MDAPLPRPARNIAPWIALAGAIALAIAWGMHSVGSNAPRADRRGAAHTPPGPEPSPPRQETASVDRLPAPAAPQPAATLHHTFAVVDLDGDPVERARILATDGEVFGDLQAATLSPQLQTVTTLLDSVTGADGELSIGIPAGTRVYLRCETASGLRIAGPRFIEASDQSPARTTFVAASILAGAVLLSDAATPLFVDWAVPSAFQIQPQAAQQLRGELAARLGLDRTSVMTVVPQQAPPDGLAPIAIYHPRIGWFRSHARVVPAEELNAPTLIEVPASGEAPPVRVTVRCVDPAGNQVDAKVRLMGGSFAPGSQQGWPRFGRTFPANEPQLFPPGLLEASFADASLVPFSRQRVEVDADATITLEAPFTPRPVALTLMRNGAIFRGRVALRMRVEALNRDFVIRNLGAPDGVMTFTAPTELACALYLRCSDGVAEIHLPPSTSTARIEQVAVFQ